MSELNANYTFCDTQASLEPVLTILRSSPILAFDCEGQDLGRRGGSLSLLSFRTIFASTATNKNKTFIFDAIKLSTTTLRPIFDLLESSTILKVVFDGRMDYSCLWHDHAVRMHHVLDLQLVDVKSRAQRGEGEYEQLNRLAGVVTWDNLSNNRAQYAQIHRLSGLRPCAEEHKVVLPPRGDYMDHSAWLRRPLSDQQLTYAANDVLIIQRVFASFTNANYLYPAVYEDSMRYASLWSDNQLFRGDIERYRSHALLPLNIINMEAAKDLPMDNCRFCSRSLPQPCFPTPTHTWHRESEMQCFVCRAVSPNNPGSGGSARTGYRNRFAEEELYDMLEELREQENAAIDYLNDCLEDMRHDDDIWEF